MNHTIVDIETLFKQDLDDLWDINKKKDRTFERGYAIEKKLVSDSILFIGMNPSYDEEKALHGGFYIPQEGHYFSKAMRIAKDRKAPFCHHDLFFIRETNQNTVLCLRKKYSAFFAQQIDITKRIISLAKPLMIIIINASACRIFQEVYSFEPLKNWNSDLGVDILPQLGNIPVIFSSMLSGQRALDLVSYTTLRWHVGHICDKLNIHF